MKNKKIFPIMAIITIFIVGIAMGVSGCFMGGRTYELNLPKFENLRSISIERNAEKTVIDGSEEMEDFLNILTGDGRTTRSASVQDAPVNADEVIKVEFNFSETGASTIFVYQKSGKYYIEQPYNGIYQISADDYNGIERIIG